MNRKSKSFGEYIRKLRTDWEFSLRDIERYSGVSNAYISQVETGKRSIPSMRILIKLAKAYGVPAKKLIRRAEAETRKSMRGVS